MFTALLSPRHILCKSFLPARQLLKTFIAGFFFFLMEKLEREKVKMGVFIQKEGEQQNELADKMKKCTCRQKTRRLIGKMAKEFLNCEKVPRFDEIYIYIKDCSWKVKERPKLWDIHNTMKEQSKLQGCKTNREAWGFLLEYPLGFKSSHVSFFFFNRYIQADSHYVLYRLGFQNLLSSHEMEINEKQNNFLTE